jgi:hypothetical protein
VAFEQFETPGQVTLRVINQSGDVEVRTHERPTTEVELHPSGDNGDEIVRRTRVEHHCSDGHHDVVVDVPRRAAGRLGLLFGRGSGVRVVVRLPELSRIGIETTSGAITASGRYGAASLDTASGEAVVGAVEGDVSVNTASGDVEVASAGGSTRIRTASGDVRGGALAGDVSVNTASGDVRIESAGGRLVVNTASGDITVGDVSDGCTIRSASGDQQIRRARAGEARLDAVSGDLVIGVPRRTVVDVDAQSVTGDLSSEIDLDGAADHAGGEASLKVRARTISGDVRVTRADPDR